MFLVHSFFNNLLIYGNIDVRSMSINAVLVVEKSFASLYGGGNYGLCQYSASSSGTPCTSTTTSSTSPTTTTTSTNGTTSPHSVQLTQGGATSGSRGTLPSGNGTLLTLLIIGTSVVVIALILLIAGIIRRRRQRLEPPTQNVEPPQIMMPR